MAEFGTSLIPSRQLKADRQLSIPVDDQPLDPHKQRMRRFVQLEKERRELEARLDLIKEEEVTLKEQIGDYFEESGTQRENVDGLTVYLKYQTWARPKDGDMQRLCAALQTCGMGELVQPNVNLQTLSAVVREKIKEAIENDTPESEVLPAPVMDALAVTHNRYLASMTGRTPRSKSVKDGENDG